MPRRFTTPGRNASTKTSAVSVSDSNASRPCSDLRSKTMLFLPRWVLRNHTLWPPLRYPRRRVGSPSPGGSTLITSAPWSAIIIVRCGPGKKSETSMTRKPSSFMSDDAFAAELGQLGAREAGLSEDRIGVSTERGSRLPSGTLTIDPDRACDNFQVAAGGMREGEHAFCFPEVGIIQCLRQREHGGGWHASGEALHPFLRGRA